MKKIPYALCAALILFTAAAYADDEETARWRQRTPVYNAYDLDRYDNARIVSGGQIDFKAADEDGDGEISRTEVRRYLRDYERSARDTRSRQDARLATDHLSLRIRSADRNGDGKVTAEEHQEYETDTRSSNRRPAYYYRSSEQ